MKKEKDQPSIVPEQRTGKDIEVKGSVLLPHENAAREFFRIAMDRLQSVSGWARRAGNLSAEFQLTDPEGNIVNRKVSKGDFLRIDIPGPGNASGDGYDWVEVEETELTASPDSDRYSFRVRPAQDPLSRRADIAHFYSGESSSTFTVVREKNVVTAAVYDRNTKPNTEAGTTAGKIRDTLVGAAGLTTFSRIQWENLVNGILKTE